MPRSALTPGSCALAHELSVVALDRVAGLEVVEVLEGDAALLAGDDLAHVVLHAAQRLHATVVDHLAPPPDARQPAPGDGPLEHETAGRLRGLARPEHLPDLRGAPYRLAIFGLQHACQRAPHVVYERVDYRVQAEVDALALRRTPRGRLGPHVEADDDAL